jgi:glycosyltransferase involved in cell wall biosynthesis
MRTLAVSHYAAWGGPTNGAQSLAPLLRMRGIETVVLLPEEEGDAPDRLRASGVETVQIPLHRLRRTMRPGVHTRYFTKFAGEVGAIRKVLRDYKINVVQIYGLNLQGGIAGRLEGVPVVWQLLDVGNPILLRRLTMPIVLRLADVLMSTGMAVAQAHPGATGFKDRLFSFFPPVDLNRFKADPEIRAAARTELGIGPDDLVIGTVGNITPQKDHFAFVRAAVALKRQIPAARFVILGATVATRREFAQRVSKYAQKMGLCLDRDMTIRNPGARVSHLAQAFDIFWLTSLWEGMPTAVEEAMTLKLPVVSVDVGSMREAIENNVNGFVVPARDQDAMIRTTMTLARDPGLRMRIGAQAHSFAVKNFDAKICAEVHARAFERAIANRPGAHRNGFGASS